MSVVMALRKRLGETRDDVRGDRGAGRDDIGRNRRLHRIVTSILFLLLTVTILLIIDLDRPSTGGITTSRQPVMDTRTAMR
jgi:hypothetical protein